MARALSDIFGVTAEGYGPGVTVRAFIRYRRLWNYRGMPLLEWIESHRQVTTWLDPCEATHAPEVLCDPE